MKKALKLVRKYGKATGKSLNALQVYDDWSGRLIDYKGARIFSFHGYKDLITKLKKGIKKNKQ